MSPSMMTPAGFRPLRTRGRVIPINIMRRRGLGDAASDYASIAAQLAPGSAMQQLFSGCAANPTAPACASAAQGALSTPYLTGADYQATVNAIAAGQAPPPVTAYTGPPPRTSLPTPAPSAPAAPVATVSQSASGPVITATPQIQSVAPVQTVQPAGMAQPPGTTPAPTGSVGFLSTTFLGFPLWAWGVGAVGAYFLFFSGGKHGRY